MLGRPKTKAGLRQISLPAGIVMLLKAHQEAQRRERWALGEAYIDGDLIFWREDGSVLHPETVSRVFKTLAVAAGLPPIRLHDGRHTAASLALEACLDVKVVSAAMGHSNTQITRDLYQHVRVAVADEAAAAADEAAAAVESLVTRRARAKETGS